MASNVIYTAGVCNIGPDEIRARKRFGWLGLVVTIVLWAVLAALAIPRGWRLIVFIPAFMSAIGFLQGFLHFCAHFGMAGLFNFGPVGKTEAVKSPEFRALDRKRSWQIIIYSLIVAVVVTVAGLFLF